MVPDSITGEADDLRGWRSPQILVVITGSSPGLKSAEALGGFSSGRIRHTPVAVELQVSIVEGRFLHLEGKSPLDFVAFCGDVVLGSLCRLKTTRGAG